MTIPAIRFFKFISIKTYPYKARFISFIPAMDQFLKGHLFSDIFGRDNLDFQSREIATISALSSMTGSECAAAIPFQCRL